MADFQVKLKIDDSDAQRASQQTTQGFVRLRDEAGRFVSQAEGGIKRVAAATEGAVAPSGRLGDSFREIGARVGQSTNLITQFGGQLAALAAPAAILRTIADAYQEVGNQIRTAAEASQQFERQQRELAALLGKTQPGQVVGQSLRLALSTGLEATQANLLQRQFEGSVPIGFQKGNITRDVADQLLVAAGQTAARQGGDAGTKGELAGLLAQFGKVTSAQQGLGQLESIRQALTEGRGDDTPLTRQLLKVAGSAVRAGGPVPSLPELASVIGVTSLSAGPEEAGTRAEQLIRFLSETQGAGAGYLKRIGVTEGMGLEQKLGLLKQDVNVNAQGRDLTAYLSQSVGGGNFMEIQSAVETLGNYDVFVKRLAAARQAATRGGADVAAANREYLQAGAGGQTSDTSLLAANVATGQRFRDIQNLFKLQEAEFKIQGRDQSVVAAASDIFYGALSFQGPSGGRQQAIEQAAVDRLYRQGQMVPGLTERFRNEIPATATRAEQGRAMIEMLRGVGVDPFAGFTSKLDQVVQALDKNTQATNANTRPNAQQPQVKPIGPPSSRPTPQTVVHR